MKVGDVMTKPPVTVGVLTERDVLTGLKQGVGLEAEADLFPW